MPVCQAGQDVAKLQNRAPVVPACRAASLDACVQVLRPRDSAGAAGAAGRVVRSDRQGTFMGAFPWAEVCSSTALCEVISWILIHVHLFQSEKSLIKRE